MRKLRHSAGLLREIFAFARAHKAYWMVPMIVALVILAVLIFAGQAASPFIYTLF